MTLGGTIDSVGARALPHRRRPVIHALMPSSPPPFSPDPRSEPERSRRTGDALPERLQLWLSRVAENRDREAFTQLFSHFAPRLKAYVMKAGTDAAMAEEVVQDALVTVWRKAHTYDPSKANVSTWIFTIVRNKRIDRLRRERRPTPVEEYQLNTLEEPISASRRLEAVEAHQIVTAALETLPAEQVEVLKKAYFEDLSHQAIADDLGLPLGTVKSRIRLALQRLRATVEQDDDR